MRNNRVPLAICLAFALMLAAVAAAQFVGWPLDATEVDFPLIPTILAHQQGFAGTPYLALAQSLKALTFMPRVIDLLAWAGITPERQQFYFRAMQTLFVCFGVLATFFALGGRRRGWLVLLAFLLFVASGQHQLFYFKIVSSTFVAGLLILAVSCALAGRLWMAAGVLVLVGGVHPTFFVLTLSSVLLVYWVSEDAPLAALSRARLRPLAPIAVVTGAFALLWLVNIRAIIQPSTDSAVWFDYMESRSDLVFPLHQGYAAVLGMLVPLTLVIFVFRQEWRRTGSRRFLGLAALAMYCLALIFVQIVASDIWRNATITRLALSHRLQFSFDILIYAAVIWIVLRRYVESGMLVWLALLWYALVVHAFLTPLAAPYGLTDRGTLFLVVLAMQMLDDAGTDADALRVIRVAGVSLFALFDIVYFFNPPGAAFHFLFWILVSGIIEIFLRRRWSRVEYGERSIPSIAIAAVLLVAASQVIQPRTWRTALGAVHAYFLDARHTDYADFVTFVTSNVPENAQILIVPLFLSETYTPVPYRAVYLDWGESNYVLYLGGYINYVIARLHTYGIDPMARPPECTVPAMFLARPGSSLTRCMRTAFQNQTAAATTQWRDHTREIRELSPQTAWVMIRQNLLCHGERPAAVWHGIALIPLNDVIPQSNCATQ